MEDANRQEMDSGTGKIGVMRKMEAPHTLLGGQDLA